MIERNWRGRSSLLLLSSQYLLWLLLRVKFRTVYCCSLLAEGWQRSVLDLRRYARRLWPRCSSLTLSLRDIGPRRDRPGLRGPHTSLCATTTAPIHPWQPWHPQCGRKPSCESRLLSLYTYIHIYIYKSSPLANCRDPDKKKKNYRKLRFP